MIYNAPMANKQNYTFRFDPDLIEQVDKQAARESRSRTNMIEVMARDYLKARSRSSQVDSGLPHLQEGR